MAIARALLKDSPTLMLDEPTENLDVPTSLCLLNALFSQPRGLRSILVITHRLEGMEYLDEILVMNDGKILQRGTHAKLLSREGLYQHLWLAHNRMFRQAVQVLK